MLCIKCKRDTKVADSRPQKDYYGADVLGCVWLAKIHSFVLLKY